MSKERITLLVPESKRDFCEGYLIGWLKGLHCDLPEQECLKDFVRMQEELLRRIKRVLMVLLAAKEEGGVTITHTRVDTEASEFIVQAKAGSTLSGELTLEQLWRLLLEPIGLVEVRPPVVEALLGSGLADVFITWR